MGSIDPADVSRVNGICIKCCACVKSALPEPSILTIPDTCFTSTSWRTFTPAGRKTSGSYNRNNQNLRPKPEVLIICSAYGRMKSYAVRRVPLRHRYCRIYGNRSR